MCHNTFFSRLRGHIVTTLEEGKDNETTIVSDVPVDDGLPHIVEVVADEENVTLVLDGEVVGTIASEDGNENFLDSPIYVGGLPEDFEEVPLEDHTSFQGNEVLSSIICPRQPVSLPQGPFVFLSLSPHSFYSQQQANVRRACVQVWFPNGLSFLQVKSLS